MRFYPAPDPYFYYELFDCIERKSDNDWKSKKYETTKRLLYWRDVKGAKMEKVEEDEVKPSGFKCKTRRPGAFLPLHTDIMKKNFKPPEFPDPCDNKGGKGKGDGDGKGKGDRDGDGDGKGDEGKRKNRGCYAGMPQWLPSFQTGPNIPYKSCKVGAGITPPVECCLIDPCNPACCCSGCR